jgi:glycosyltransferase involved in cell wall biosynthesis
MDGGEGQPRGLARYHRPCCHRHPPFITVKAGVCTELRFTTCQKSGMTNHHILEIIGSGAPSGGTSVVLGLSRGLVARGFRVTIATHRQSYLVEEAERSGIEVLPLDFTKRMSSPKLALQLRNYIFRSNVVVAHAHGSRAGLPLAMLSGNTRIPWAYSVHGFHYQSKMPGLRHIARQIEGFIMARTSKTIFVSNYDKGLAFSDRLINAEQPARVIWNGAIPPESDAVPDTSRTFDIAFLGRLHFQKDPLIIPQILLAMRPARPTLAIIGGGDLESALRIKVAEAGLNDQVSFFGECSHQQGVELLGQARIMLLPSINEGLSMSIIEAMHAGVPTVASTVGGVPEQIENGKSGFLVKQGDVKGFAQRLCDLLDHPGMRAEMGSRARDIARTRFSLARNVEDHISVYNTLLRQQPLARKIAAPA